MNRFATAFITAISLTLGASAASAAIVHPPAGKDRPRLERIEGGRQMGNERDFRDGRGDREQRSPKMDRQRGEGQRKVHGGPRHEMKRGHKHKIMEKAKARGLDRDGLKQKMRSYGPDRSGPKGKFQEGMKDRRGHMRPRSLGDDRPMRGPDRDGPHMRGPRRS